jgi:inner membrane protein
MAMIGWSALSMAPDLDVIAFALRIPYEAPFGHRGATHSIGASILAGGLGVLLARLLGWAPLRTGIFAFAVVLSHALLDTLTNGGLGCALLWPLSNERYFAPVALIPVAPIGLGMLSLRGFLVVCVETVLFSPLFIYATFPRRRPKAG